MALAETATEVGAEEEAEAEAAQQTHQGHSYSHSQAQLLQPLSILHRRVLFTVCSQIKLRIKAETERENAREWERHIHVHACVWCVCVCSYLPLYLGEFAGSRNEFSTILLYRVVFSFFLFGFQCRAYSLTCSRSCSLSLSRSLSFSLCACTFSQLSMPCCKSISCLCVCVWVLYAYPAHTDAHTLKMFISWHCPLEIIISHAQNRPLDLLNYPEEWRHVCSRRREERTPAINSDS